MRSFLTRAPNHRVEETHPRIVGGESHSSPNTNRALLFYERIKANHQKGRINSETSQGRDGTLIALIFLFNLMTFGNGPVIIPLLQGHLVNERGVLTQEQLLIR